MPVFFVLLLLWTGSDAQADIGNLDDFTSIANLPATGAEDLIKTVGIGLDHHAYMPASPLGLVVGLDAGIEVTMLAMPQSFIDTMTAIGVDTSLIPDPIPAPRLNIHKGLPYHLDVGFSWFGGFVQDVLSVGAEVQWTFMQGAALPSLAVRGSYAYNHLVWIRTRTLTFDVVASKNFFNILEPYAGFGLQIANGTLSVPVDQIPVDIPTEAEVTSPRMMVGGQLSLLILKFVAEYDYSFAGVSNIGFKFSIGI